MVKFPLTSLWARFHLSAYFPSFCHPNLSHRKAALVHNLLLLCSFSSSLFMGKLIRPPCAGMAFLQDCTDWNVYEAELCSSTKATKFHMAELRSFKNRGPFAELHCRSLVSVLLRFRCCAGLMVPVLCRPWRSRDRNKIDISYHKAFHWQIFIKYLTKQLYVVSHLWY